MNRSLSRYFVALCLLLPMYLFAAAPTISSFTPTSGTVGSSVVLTGTAFTGATAVKFNGVAASSYTVNSSTKITAFAPTGVTTGKLSVTTAGGSATSSSTFTVGLPPAITTQPTNQTVNLGSTSTFMVATSGTAPLSYQWSKNGAAITGATSASYTTPATVTGDNGKTFSVKVTSPFGSVTSSTATLTVTPVVVTVAPTSVSVAAGGTQPFTATVTGTQNTAVTWSVIGGTTKGTISTSGLYTAPAVAATDTVVAKSSVDTTKTASATVTVKVPVFITISPDTITLTVSRGMTFGYSISNATNTNVTWSVIEAGGGTVDAQGNYTAPSTPGVYTVQVASVQDATKVSQCKVTVVAAPDGTITAPTSITAGATGLVASVPSQAGSTYAWTITGGTLTAGAATNVATFTAGTGTSLTLTCKVTNGAGDSVTSSKTLPVSAAQPVAVTISPSTITLAPGGTQLFTDTVTGSSNLNTTWSYSAGSLVQSGSGMLYTAPATVGTYSLVVSSDADPTKTATATITVQAPGINVSLTPSVVTIAPSATQDFSATVTGSANTSVTWSVLEAGGGSINVSGTYTAPSSTGTYTVKAATVADPTKVATAIVTVSNSTVTVSIDPSTVTLVPGETQLFTATVTGTTNLSTQWSYNGGTLAQSGGGMLFTAPATTGTYTITVAAAADPTKTAKATITVSTDVPVGITVSPASTTLPLGGNQAFTATVTGTTNKAVTWSVTGGTTKGTITPEGIYTAPATAVTDIVMVKSAADTTKTASATVTVSAVMVAISPTAITLASGMEFLFSATVTGAVAPDVIWSVTEAAGGTIYANGNYVTPTLPGTYHVVARSQSVPTVFATATVIVVAPITVTISPASADIVSGSTATFTSNVPVNWGFWSGIGGSISYNSTQVTYTPPAGSTGAEVLTATSKIDPSKSVDIPIWVRAVGSPVISSFNASLLQILAGQPITLSWAVAGATSGDLSARPISGGQTSLADPVAVSNLTVSPIMNTDYILEAYNASGTDQRTISVSVIAPTVDSFAADELVPTPTIGTTLRGTFHNGTGNLQPGVGPVSSGFAITVNPSTQTTYTLTVTNSLGVSSTSTLTITPKRLAGSFAPTGNLNEPRIDHMAIKLLDGRVLLANGSNTRYGDTTQGADLFDPATGTFSALSLQSGTGRSATMLMDGRVLLIGGLRIGALGVDFVGNITIWDPVSGEITSPLAGFNRLNQSATLLLDGRVLIAGGNDPRPGQLFPQRDNPVSEALIFDPIDWSFTLVGSMVSSSGPNSGLLLPDGRVLIEMTWGAQNLEIFDPGTQTFSALPLPSGAVSGHPLLLADGRVLCGNQILDSKTMQFSPSATLPQTIPKTRLGDGEVFSGYLQFNTAYYNTLIFDPLRGTVLATDPPTVNRSSPTSTLLSDGRLLLAGGSHDGYYGYPVIDSSAEIFDPQCPLNIQGNGGIVNAGDQISLILSGSDASTPVTWTCSGGSIDASGVWTTPASGGLFWVQATSQSDAMVRATALYMVRPVRVSFSMPSVTVLKYGQVSLQAVVSGASSPALTWAITEGPVAGTISQNGVFTAGGTPGVYHVVATSVVDLTKSATCTIKIPSKLPPVITQFTVDKNSVVAGSPVTFFWTVVGDGVDQVMVDILYQNQPVSGYQAGGTWAYTPTKPTTAPVDTLYFTLRAQNSYGTVTKSLAVDVGDPLAIQITPINPMMFLGDTQQFTATYWGSGLPVPNVAWSLSPSTVGSISSTGLFTSASAGLSILTATNLDAPAVQPTTTILRVMERALPVISSFYTNGILPLKPGASTNLFWSISSTTGLILTSTAGESWDVTQSCFAGSGGLSITPNGTTSYSLQASNALGGTSLTVDVPVSIGVGILPLQTTVSAGGLIQISAVTNGVTGVVWSVLEANGGTINQSGLYTAPFQAGNYTIVATAASNPALMDSLRISVRDGVPITVPGRLLDPNSSVTLTTGSSITFASSYFTGVIWSVLEPGGGTITNAGGSMGTGGIYTAPMTPGTYTVVATSYSDPNMFGQFKVIVVPPITITPTMLTMPTGSSQKFGYTLIAPTNNVTWSASGGTIAADGTYTAPLVPGTYTVTVTGVDDTAATASAAVTVVYSDVTLSVTPIANLFPGQTIRMGYQSSAGGVIWTASGGSFNGDSYTAPFAAGTYTITATAILNPSVSASIQVVVVRPQIMIAPTRAVVAMSSTYQFQWAVTGGSLLWSVVEPGGGSINNTGLYTAPSTAGTYTVRAVSSADSSVTATATVVVNTTGGSGAGTGGGSSTPPQMVGVEVSPALSTVRAGTYQAFNASVSAADDQAVTWAVAGNPTTAKVDGQGIFTASHPGQYQVVATSVTSGTSWGSATVVVTSSVDTLADKVPVALNRHGYSVTALPSGMILIAGGWDGSAYRSDCYLYDPSTQAFTQTGSMLETKYTVIDPIQGGSTSMTVSAGRSGHTATLLKDGRVLIANGVGYWSNDALPPPTDWARLPFAQIYDPANGTFQLLPGRAELPTVPGWIGLRANHQDGLAVALGSGQALLAGDAGLEHNTQSLFDSVNGAFSDLNTCGIGTPNSSTPGCGAGIGGSSVAAVLDDGRVLIAGGWIPWLLPAPELDSWVDNAAALYDPQTGFSPVGPMTSKRTQATATKLADGRVLIVGGASTTTRGAYGTGTSYFIPTATAEIFDPKTGVFTSTTSMQLPRSAHAAILLPTGQVLVVGGYTSQTVNADGSSVLSYSTETELYDPDSNTWRVMDHLDYGLQDPKLALLPDGSVFIAGTQITTAASPQAAMVGNVGNGKLKAVNGLMAAAGTLPALPGTTFFGTLPPSFRIQIDQDQKEFLIAPHSASSDEPTMPTIPAKLLGILPSLQNVPVEWKIRVDYNTRQKSPISLWDEYSMKTTGDKLPTDFFQQVGAVRGGNLTIYAKVTFPSGAVISSEPRTDVKIHLGDQPDGSRVVNRLVMGTQTFPDGPSIDGATLTTWIRAIACKESRQRHNAESNSPGTFQYLGEPKMNMAPGDGGIGLMQRTPIDFERKYPAVKDWLWNWGANVDEGIRQFRQEKLKTAYEYPRKVLWSNGFTVALANTNRYRQSINLPILNRIRVPLFTSEQLLLDGVRGYNGFAGTDPFGLYLHEYRLKTQTTSYGLIINWENEGPDPDDPTKPAAWAVWERVPASDRPDSGLRDYVEAVRAYVTQPCGN